MKIKFRFSSGEERRKWRKIHSSFWEFSLLHISFVKNGTGIMESRYGWGDSISIIQLCILHIFN